MQSTRIEPLKLKVFSRAITIIQCLYCEKVETHPRRLFPLFAPSPLMYSIIQVQCYTPSITNVDIAQWHVQVATSAVWPKGQVPATKKETRLATRSTTNKNNILTCAKRYHGGIGGAEQARVDAIELAIDDTVQLRVTRRLFAE